MLRGANDPEGRIEREFRSASAEARSEWNNAGRPLLQRD